MVVLSEARRKQLRDGYRDTGDLMILVIGNIGRRMAEWSERQEEMRRFPGPHSQHLDIMEGWWKRHDYR